MNDGVGNGRSCFGIEVRAEASKWYTFLKHSVTKTLTVEWAYYNPTPARHVTNANGEEKFHLDL